MKVLPILIFSLFLATSLAVSASYPGPHDACDSYGDCVSASITFTRANPDDSLYLGDQFVISLQIQPGTGSTGCGSGCSQSWSGSLSGVSWSYDQSVFDANASGTSATFIATANMTGSHTLSATASFLVTITSCVSSSSGTSCSSSQAYSPITASEQVQTKGFTLASRAQMTNATTPLHQLRRNPDSSFYPYDAFYLNYTYSFPFMQQRPDIRVRVTPTYNGTVLNLASYSNATNAGYFFFQMDNRTGSYAATLTAKATNWLQQKMGIRTSSIPYQIIPLLIDFHTSMGNVTVANKLVAGGKELLRNPDGSFYRNDSFAVSWNATFQFSTFRKDIRVNVTSVNPTNLETVNIATAPDGLGREGTFTYRIGLSANYQPYTLVLRAQVLNWYNDSLALTTSKQPYAVVKYDPLPIARFTYMLYNSRNASTYGRPFVTLVRYSGNNPGYSYAGDINTAPITSLNDTRERAWINGFAFVTDGWVVNFASKSSDIRSDITFARHAALNMSIIQLNSSTPMITWDNRVQKYYFEANQSEIAEYVREGMSYLNLTERARSSDFAGGVYPLFNTTYLYEPVYYSGHLILRAYTRTGAPDAEVNITVTAVDPSPLNLHLLASLKDVFANDSAVSHAFERDLYRAYNVSQVLRPSVHSAGVWVYALNQTNLASVNATALPCLLISVSGHGATYNLTTPLTFSSFALAKTTLPALPFGSVTVSYLDATRQLIAQPLSFSFASYMPFVEWDYNITGKPSFFSPISYEPGNLSKVYPFLFGRNTTIIVNLDGGGVMALPSQNGYVVNVNLLADWDSGGITTVWAEERGKQIGSYALTPNSLPPSPSGFTGTASMTFWPDGNGTVSIWVRNSWGVDSKVGNISVTIHTPPSPPFPTGLVWWFVFIVVLFYAVGRLISRRKS